uniref:Polyglutamylase complex subunit TTLL1 n=1 Tax=Timema douglasi TaxID=61478 RepID=A0A7R8Z9X7_TIMDO|nr:unnamed protein product [Timema douglasi]
MQVGTSDATRAMPRVKFAVDQERCVVLENFQKRGWIQVDPENDWNVYWAGTGACKNLFHGENKYRFGDDQIINHFPTFYEISRKDNLVRNFKRYRREVEKQKHSPVPGCKQGPTPFLDFLPTSYVLPGDFNLFVEEFRRDPHTTWILKPSSKSQGSGIFLVNNLSKLRRWSQESKEPFNPKSLKENFVISKYIDNPLLIGNKKFDLRMYVLVTSFKPLKAYLYDHGFCRFCTVKYDTSIHKLDDLYVHLTNVAIQKHGMEYNSIHGGKLSVQNLRLFLEGTRGKSMADKLFSNISHLIVHTLKAVAPIMALDRHCFECYGYDIIVDNSLKPWLIEVNSSPSLIFTTESDRILKHRLVDDILSIVVPPNGVPNARWSKRPSRDRLGGFQVLVDEEDQKCPKSVSGRTCARCNKSRTLARPWS